MLATCQPRWSRARRRIASMAARAGCVQSMQVARHPREGARPDQPVVAAVAAAQAQESVGKDAAFEEDVELVFDELCQIRPGGHLCLGEEGCGVLLHQAA
jgi:hypothetical protein